MKSGRVQAFLFDYGGVLTAGGGRYDLPARLGAALGVGPDEAFGFLAPVWTEYVKGKIIEAQLWQHIAQASGRDVPPEKRAIWNTWEHMAPLPEMKALLKRLKADGYTIGLLSNVVPNTEREIRAHGGYDLLDFLVLSCEIGFAKPDKEIYEFALAQLPGISPEQIVYIDDQERCLVPARELGLQTILAASPQQTITAVEKLLV